MLNLRAVFHHSNFNPMDEGTYFAAADVCRQVTNIFTLDLFLLRTAFVFIVFLSLASAQAFGIMEKVSVGNYKCVEIFRAAENKDSVKFSQAMPELTNSLKELSVAPQRKLVVSPDGVSSISTVEDWFESGIKVELPGQSVTSKNQLFLMRRALSKARLDNLNLSTFSQLPGLSPKNSAKYLRVISGAMSAREFIRIYGIEPTIENFDRLEALMTLFQRWKIEARVASFPSYQELQPLPRFPARISQDKVKFIEGIRKLWNQPTVVVSLMKQVGKMVQDQVLIHHGISEEQALEAIRNEFEFSNRFSAGVTDLHKILTAEEFGNELQKGNPVRDPNGSHSLERLNGYGQNRHRDQWLIIMFARKEFPAMFGNSQIPAAEIFKALGNLTWEGSTTAVYENNPSLVQNGPWYYLFDNIGNSGYADVANMADPIYFGEIWNKVTGFRSWY